MTDRLFELTAELHETFAAPERSPAENRIAIDNNVVDFDMDHNLQREVIVDQIFLAMHFCYEKKLSFPTSKILIDLIIDEFQSMITRCFDKNASGDARMSVMKSKFMNMTKEEANSNINLQEWKLISVYLVERILHELDAYYFLFTNIPSVAEKNIPLFVDTPIANLAPLSQV